MEKINSSNKRIHLVYIILSVLLIIVGLKLFYLQVISGRRYRNLALASQLKQYEIPAERGSFYAYDGTEVVPLVLNETKYRVVADPKVIKNPEEIAQKLAGPLGVPSSKISELLSDTELRYQILAQKVDKNQKKQIEDLKLPGVFTNEQVAQRAYVQGDVAGQVLGFVNNEGQGTYGLEQYLDQRLRGQPGQVKALTDKNNVPLLASGKNVLTSPVDGEDIVLSLDVSMQRQAQKILKAGLDSASSKSGSIIIMNPNNGEIKAMANYPSYDPAKFSEVTDQNLYINPSVSSPLEPGSTVKTLTTAAALSTGSVKDGQTYYDPSSFHIDNATVRNIEEDGGAATRSVSDILQFSLNTGATWLLMQMGDGQINEKARNTWYDYMTNHYRFGQTTGVEQGYEAVGTIPSPTEGYGLNITYANTSFGQGMTVTPLQMAAAVSSVVNGGKYYRPTLIAGKMEGNNFVPKSPEVLNDSVVNEQVSSTLIKYMNNVVSKNNLAAVRDGYQVGGKTGTAEIAKPEGGYYEDKFNGTYVGYVGGDRPEYVIMVRVNEPKINGYAGSRAAGPIFASTSNMLIDNFNVPRKRN